MFVSNFVKLLGNFTLQKSSVQNLFSSLYAFIYRYSSQIQYSVTPSMADSLTRGSCLGLKDSLESWLQRKSTLLISIYLMNNIQTFLYYFLQYIEQQIDGGNSAVRPATKRFYYFYCPKIIVFNCF